MAIQICFLFFDNKYYGISFGSISPSHSIPIDRLYSLYILILVFNISIILKTKLSMFSLFPNSVVLSILGRYFVLLVKILINLFLFIIIFLLILLGSISSL